MNSKKTVKKTSKRTSKQSILPKRSPYKFLTRNIKFYFEDNLAFNQIRIKGLYLKKFVDDRFIDHGFRGIDYRLLKNRKLLKTLRHAEIPAVNRTIIHESLKTSKNLKTFCIHSPSRKTRLDMAAFYLRRLPANIQTVNIHIRKDNQRTIEGYYKIANSLRFLPNLQSFSRWFSIRNNRQQHVQRELLTYEKSLSRLSKLNQATYILTHSEQSGFQRVMRRNFTYKHITGLDMFLTYEGFEDYDRMLPFLFADDSHEFETSLDFDHLDSDQLRHYQRVKDDIRRADEEKKDDLGNTLRILDHEEMSSSFNEFDEVERNIIIYDDEEEEGFHNDHDDEEEISSENEIEIISITDEEEEEIYSDTDEVVSEESRQTDEEFVANSIMREEMKPFFRFELFPNLKRLYISHSELLYPLGSFVVDGFAALKKIEDLKIGINESMGTNYLFKGLSKLPLLKNFDLALGYIGEENWTLLEQFLRRQNNLEAFSLTRLGASCTRACYLRQSASIEGTIKALENKTLLKYLNLDLSYCPIEAISKGLGHLKMTNQFHTLKVEAIDDSITSQTKGWKRVEGLCKFIKNQQDSLKTLEISLPIAFEENVVTKIGEAFSKLTQLRKLHLLLNTRPGTQMDEMIDYIEYGLQQGIPAKSRKELVLPTKWNPSLAKYMKRLTNLEDFDLAFFIIHSDSCRWLVDIFKVLPSLGRLRKLSVGSRCGEYFQNDEQKLISALRELHNVKKIHLNFLDAMGFYQQMLPNLNRLAKEMEKRHLTRTDLMF